MFVDLLLKVVTLVITDDGFSVPSPHAKKARSCAEQLLEWALDSENEFALNYFASKLIRILKSCFHKTTVTVRVRRERLWTNFYQLRASTEFADMWTTFLHESRVSESSPIFYQYLTDKIMDELIRQRFTLIHHNKAQKRRVLWITLRAMHGGMLLDLSLHHYK